MRPWALCAVLMTFACGESRGTGGGGGGGGSGNNRRPFGCGNGAVDGIETCDGDMIPGGAICADWGLGEGVVTCTLQCKPSFAGCAMTDYCMARGLYSNGKCDACDQLGGMKDPECLALCGGDGTCADELDPLTGKWTCQNAGAPDPDCGACGNDTLEGHELCDGGRFPEGKGACTSFGFTGGNLACTVRCVPDFSGCTRTSTVVTPMERCGNQKREGAEKCDGNEFDVESCVALGFAGGALACTASCTYDISGCTPAGPTCGDGTRSADEECDGTDFGAVTCMSLGFDGGNLGCNAGSCTIDASACTRGPRCGDGTREGTEDCDGSDLGSASCTSIGMGFDGGNLACAAAGCVFDTSGCTRPPVCGDGTRAPAEECDGSDLGGASCVSLGRGFTGGNLVCTSGGCTYDTSGCTAPQMAYRYRRDFQISGSSADLTDYQVEVVADTDSLAVAGKIRQDCQDFRFKDATGTTDLSFYRAGPCPSAATRWWVRVPAIPPAGTTIRMIYGDPTAAEAGDGNATFDWFDDFSADSSSRYNVTGVGWYTGAYDNLIGSMGWDPLNGWMSVATGDNTIALLTLPGLSMRDLAVDVRMNCRRTYPDSKLLLILFRAHDATHWFGANATLETSAVSRTGVEKKIGTTSVNSIHAARTLYPLNQWVRMSAAIAGSSILVAINGDTYPTMQTDITAAGQIMVGATQCDFDLDDLWVRKYAAPEPVSVGGPEMPN